MRCAISRLEQPQALPREGVVTASPISTMPTSASTQTSGPPAQVTPSSLIAANRVDASEFRFSRRRILLRGRAGRERMARERETERRSHSLGHPAIVEEEEGVAGVEQDRAERAQRNLSRAPSPSIASHASGS